MRYLLIRNGVVENAAVWQNEPPNVEGGFWLVSDIGGPGDSAVETETGWQFIPQIREQVPVPETITPAQLRIWMLLNRGLSEVTIETAIEQAINDETEREIVLIKFRRGLVVHRADPATIAIAGLLGLEGESLDQAFREASEI